MSEKFENLSPEEQASVQEMIDKDTPSLDFRRDALKSALESELKEASKAALVRGALSSATFWLRIIADGGGQKISDDELKAVRSTLVECDLALSK